MVVGKIIRVAGHLSVHFPDGFPLEGNEVSVRREGASIILDPVVQSAPWSRISAWLDNKKDPLDSSFVAAVSEDPGPVEERDFHLLG